MTYLGSVHPLSEPSAGAHVLAPVEDDVEVVLGSVQPLASTKVPLRSARGLVLAEPETPGHDLHLPFWETPIVERAAG